MRIAYVTDSIFPYHKGGKEKRLYEISTRLASAGHDIHIYTMHWWQSSSRVIHEDGVTLHAVSKLYPLYNGDKRSIKEGVMFGLACLKLISVKADIIDVDHMPFFPVFSMWLICLLRGKKLNGTWHEALTTREWLSYMGRAGYIASAIERMSIKLPHSITAASEHTKVNLSKIHRRIRNVATAESGIDIHTIKSVKPVPVKCDVLYTGRLVKDKNIDKLIEAFAIIARKNKNVHCVIIGHGVEKNKLKKMVDTLSLGSQVTIMDPLKDSRDIYAYMKRAKVFVLPSVREGFGIVALEALACDTPVVTVDSPANAAKMLIENGENGSIVPLSASHLAEAITHWLSVEKRADIKPGIDQFDWDVIAAKQGGIYA